MLCLLPGCGRLGYEFVGSSTLGAEVGTTGALPAGSEGRPPPPSKDSADAGTDGASTEQVGNAGNGLTIEVDSGTSTPPPHSTTDAGEPAVPGVGDAAPPAFELDASSGQSPTPPVEDAGEAAPMSPVDSGTPPDAGSPQESPRVLSLGVGRQHSCILQSDGPIKCWGLNDRGQLGRGDALNHGQALEDMGSALVSPQLPGGQTTRLLAARRTCAIQADSSLRCWGDGGWGALGQENTQGLGDEPGEVGSGMLPINLGSGRSCQAVSGRGDHLCALLDDNSVKCWGRNAQGQIGIGSAQGGIGAAGGSMGDNLLAVDFGAGKFATQLSAGGLHNCVLLNDQSLRCWGANYAGQLGLGHVDSIGDEPGELGDNLAAVMFGTGLTVRAVTTGDSHTCAISNEDGLKCWGRNVYGELGQGNRSSIGGGLSQMGDNLPYVDLGVGRTVKQVSASLYHSCAVLDNGQVKCWGRNDVGQLGLGHTQHMGDGPGEMGDQLPPVDLGPGRSATQIGTGNNHSCALLDDGSVKCWGGNEFGQLGLGHSRNIGDEPEEMGSQLPALDLGL